MPTEEKKTRKSPVPASYDRITEGAMKLLLAQKVELRNALDKSIKDELEALTKNLEYAKGLVNGK